MRFGHGRSDILFFEYDMFSVLENQRRQVQNEVAGVPEQRLLNTSVEDLVRYFVEKYQLDVPVLDVENAVADQNEATVEVSGFRYGLDRGETRSVPGTAVTLEVPFSGDPKMFKVKPSTWNSAPPHAEIRDHTVLLRQSGTQLAASEVQANFDRAIKDIDQYLDWQRNDANGYNSQLPTLARQAIEQRRNKLLANQNLVSGLKFKLKERDGAPKTYAAPVHRKRIEPRLPPASSAPFKPEPTLPEEDYLNILKIIHDMTLVMERSPAAFSHMGEEDIRGTKGAGSIAPVQYSSDRRILLQRKRRERYHAEKTFAARCANRIGASRLRSSVRRIRHLLLGSGKPVELVLRSCVRTGGSLCAAALSETGRDRMSGCRWMQRSRRRCLRPTAGTGDWRGVPRQRAVGKNGRLDRMHVRDQLPMLDELHLHVQWTRSG